jgi:hypothetical protein
VLIIWGSLLCYLLLSVFLMYDIMFVFYSFMRVFPCLIEWFVAVQLFSLFSFVYVTPCVDITFVLFQYVVLVWMNL